MGYRLGETENVDDPLAGVGVTCPGVSYESNGTQVTCGRFLDRGEGYVVAYQGDRRTHVHCGACADRLSRELRGTVVSA